MRDDVQTVLNLALKDKKSTGVLTTLGEGGVIKGIPVIPTGIPDLDVGTGIGGMPEGRIIEIYGSESSSKTTTLYSIIANAQRLGHLCGMVDPEQCLSPNVLVYDAESEVYEYVKDLCMRGEFKALTFDKKGKSVIRNAKVIKTSKKEIKRIVTSYGNTIELTDEHKVLTECGYKSVSDLKIGDCIASPISIPKNRDGKGSDLYRYVGYYIADGSSGKNVITKGVNSSYMIKDIEKIVQNADCVFSSKLNNKKTYKIMSCKSPLSPCLWTFDKIDIQHMWTHGMSITDMAYVYKCPTSTIRAHLKYWNLIGECESLVFRENKLKNNKTRMNRYNIDIKPKKYYRNKILDLLRKLEIHDVLHKNIGLPKNLCWGELCSVVNGMFTGDGSVTDVDKNPRATMGYSSSSKKLAMDFCAFLMKLGINPSLCSDTGAGWDKAIWYSYITGSKSLKTVNDNLHIRGYKGRAIENAIALDRHSKVNRLKKFNGYYYKKIKSIESIGIDDTYDVTVDAENYEEQNFLAEGLIIHNCADPAWMQTNGVDVENLLFNQPDFAEEGLEMVEFLVKNGAKVIGVDSVSALVPKAEIEGNFGDSHMGLQARLMGQAMRKLTSIVKQHKAIVVFLNQTRMKIGVMFGSPVTTSGGNALKFFASMRIQTRKTNTIKQNADDKEGIGIGVEFKFVKNKLAPPYKIATGTLMFDSGFSFATNLFNAMLGNKEIVRKGAWYSYKGESLGQGAVNSIITFKELYKNDLNEMYDNYVDLRLNGGEEVEETVESLKTMLKETEDEKEIKDIRKRMKALGGKK